MVEFFAREATLGDTVRAREEHGLFWFDRLQKSSGSSLIRVVFFDVKRMVEVNRMINSLGCRTEYFKERKLLAVNVPIEAELSAIQVYLQSEADRGGIDFEEPILRVPDGELGS